MRHSVFRDGVIAGTLGATAVAILFFIVDVVAGHPLHTPLGLGRGLISVLGPGANDSNVVVIAAYTLFHYAAFIAVATLAAVIVHWGLEVPGVLAGAFVVFVATEIGFYLMSSILADSPFFGTLSWIQVASGNLLAAIVMGAYLWRTHPTLGHGLNVALRGDDDGEPHPVTPR
jgi:hypothetical protein